MKVKEYFLKDCESLLTLVKENLKLMDTVCGLNLTNNQLLISHNAKRTFSKASSKYKLFYKDEFVIFHLRLL
jgi:hypothetical protein